MTPKHLEFWSVRNLVGVMEIQITKIKCQSKKKKSQTKGAETLVTSVTFLLPLSPPYSCQWFDCLNPLCSLCLGAGLDIIMNVIFGDDFEKVALYIAFHSCWDSIVLQS